MNLDLLPITIANPLRRAPLALIVDDSCPVINLTYYLNRKPNAKVQRGKEKLWLVLRLCLFAPLR